MNNVSHKSSIGLVNWFIHNRVAANILMLLLIVGGVVSVRSMRTETFPSIDPRLITISAAYPGATPYEVAESITSRVEEVVKGIDGIKRVFSVATEGSGTINITLRDFADANDVYNDVEVAVNSLIGFPPVDAENPIISRVRVTPNVMTLALHGDVSERTIKHWIEVVEDELKQLPGIALTSINGVRDYQISIEISEASLRRYNLSFENIAQAIRASSSDIPAGVIESGQGDILLRIQEKRYRGEEFENIVIRSLPDGATLKIRDIGKVIDGFADTNLVSKFNGQRAAFIKIKRSETEDTLKVANTIRSYLATVRLPQGLSISIQEDETIRLRERINLMLKNGVVGFVLVFVILMLFLDLKLAFWTSAAIPISFLGGLMLLNFAGYSINMVSLFALIVVLGIVVDDSIVTGESIFDTQNQYPHDPNAVSRGVMNIFAPVTIGVATTMAAFAPLIFSTGTLGQIISVIPVVVITVLFISLVEAYCILPAHLSNNSRWSKGVIADIRDFFSKKLEQFTENILLPCVDRTLQWRYLTVAVFFAIAIMTISLLQAGVVRYFFFPQVESDQISIKLTMPTGTPFLRTQETMETIEHHIDAIQQEIEHELGIDPFKSISTNIGVVPASASPHGKIAASFANNIGQFMIQMIPSDKRATLSSHTVAQRIRREIANLPGIESLEIKSDLIGDAPDIEVDLFHPDEVQLNEAVEKLKTQLANIPGTKEIIDSFEFGKTEYLFRLNEQGHAVGLTSNELGRQLRAGYFGLEVMRFQRGKSEIVVYARYPKQARELISSIGDMRIRLAGGGEVALNTVAEIVEQKGYSNIKTVEGKRVVTVSASVDVDMTTPTTVIAKMENNIFPMLQERYQGLSYRFEGESREQREDLDSIKRNMMIALMFIYVLLGAQLRSYIQPFIIMTAIPFGIVGAILGHFILGHNFTFISLFGIVALTGVVVNDSVVLIDYLNLTYQDSALSLRESILKAVRKRFRPILLTTLSTSFGLLPILLEKSIQAKFLIPMVVSLSLGLLFSTFVIIFLIPSMILLMEDARILISKLRSKISI